MRYLALACDYDGTLAKDGRVDEETLKALTRCRESGRKLILVTGREIEDLLRVFPRAELFDRIVAENGALLYHPKTREEKPLTERPPERFIDALRGRGIEPLSVGRVIIATWTPHETAALEVIRDLGLEYHVIFNKGAVMILPSAVNKATGLKAACKELGLSMHNVAGVGDAENDHAFLRLCECSAAVANALPSIKERVDYVTRSGHGAGVTELIDRLIDSDLAELEPMLGRHELLLGMREDGREFRLDPYRLCVMLAGSSGGGKTTFVTSFLERLVEHVYQFCIVDPEGDYESFEEAVALGDQKRAPSLDVLADLLKKPKDNAVANLLGIKIEDRPAFFEKLFLCLQEIRGRTGHPHWIIVDEAHHMLPPERDLSVLAQELHATMLVTIEPDHVAPSVLSRVDVVISVGETVQRTLRKFAEATGEPTPAEIAGDINKEQAVVWMRRSGEPPFPLNRIPPKSERRRHLRKYAEGDLGEEESFYFQGPEGKLHLKAQNLRIFNQMAEGVDDETWLYHLRRGDYSRWFRERIKDDALAQEAEQIERANGLSPRESRGKIREVVEKRYTAPA
jgi:hypothetical protein